MALLKCHECGNQVSSSAKTCPSCGAKVKKPTNWRVWGGLAAFFAIAMAMRGGNPPEAARPVAEKPAVADTTPRPPLVIRPASAIPDQKIEPRRLSREQKQRAAFEACRRALMESGTVPYVPASKDWGDESAYVFNWNGGNGRLDVSGLGEMTGSCWVSRTTGKGEVTIGGKTFTTFVVREVVG